ncbi:MAG: 3-octaprenyl-4-hydroxybenzoate carboxy-lyase partner protein [Chloroflexi bacterium ADurb.Bin360]|nr:MAG: 3-octaprenyl-4-hydroxybenzoate carboxy-lyase partner protein [Chloroflexi bacterium ADurb.Bin360]
MEKPITTNHRFRERLVVGITGASGAAYGVRLLEALHALDVETHLVISEPGQVTLALEMECTPEDLEPWVARRYASNDFAAAIAMSITAVRPTCIAPCSTRTLSAIAHSHTDDLISRAADVTLKEGRPLLLMVRETPLHLGHLRLMVQATELGAIIFPPVPAFYTHPRTVEDLVQQTVGRILSRMGFANTLYTPWNPDPETD